MEDTPINEHRHRIFSQRRRSIIPIIVLVLLFIKLGSSLFGSADILTVKADTMGTEVVQPLHNPSPKPHHFLAWTVGGFRRQPGAYYSIKRGETVVLDADTVRPYYKLSVFSPVRRYEWHMNIDGQGWKSISSDKRLTVKTSDKNLKNHDIYFQTKQSYNNNNSTTYYSKMSHVHISDHEVKADKLDVSLGSDYLYSLSENDFVDNSTYATATPFPQETTGKVQWTLGEFQGSKTIPIFDNEVGSISDDGLVVAKEGAEGILNITGYVINSDGTFVSNNKKLTVGGGLVDQKGHVGSTTIFQIETGKSDENSDQLKEIDITWHQVKRGKDSVVNNNSADPLKLVTNKLTEADDGTKYYAIFKYKKATMRTRIASLTVLPPLDPTVSLVTKVDNLSYDKEITTNNILNNVTSEDEIKYTFLLKNAGLRDLKQPMLTFSLNDQTAATSIKVNDKEITSHEISKDEKTGHQLVTIPIEDLSHNENHTVTVISKTQTIDDEQSFSFRPNLIGYYNDMNHRYESNGDLITLNYTTNEINAEFGDINFQTINPFERNIFKYRTQATNEIVSINDTRRNKVPLKLFVKQISEFTDEKGNRLDANLSFRETNNSPVSVGQKVKVAESKRDNPFESVRWDEEQGLILHVADSYPKPGNYQAVLVWNFENTI